MYTPLISNRVIILEEALNVDLISTPRKIPTPLNADTPKHCRYHHNFGHTIEECLTLKEKIEELIQVGHLHNFVKRKEGDSLPEENERGGTRIGLT